MEQEKSKIEKVLEHLQAYSETVLRLLQLKAGEKLADAISFVFTRLVILAFLLIAIVFLSIAAALFISERLGSSFSGFLVVSCFYLILGFALYIGRKRWLKNRTRNAVIRFLFKQHSDNE